MELRQYQKDAVESVYKHLHEKPQSNPCVVLPNRLAQEGSSEVP